MSLALPPEVGEAAALALGQHWPQVDEDALSGAAGAYRGAATTLSTAAGDADRHAQRVLAASSGGLARGLRSAADRLFGTENSDVSATTAQCSTLAESLTADAGAIRQTKVLITFELCALTETLAALRTASNVSGGMAQLLVPQAVAATTTSIEAHYQRLVEALSAHLGSATQEGLQPGAAGPPLTVATRGPQATGGATVGGAHDLLAGITAADDAHPGISGAAPVTDTYLSLSGRAADTASVTVPSLADALGNAGLGSTELSSVGPSSTGLGSVGPSSTGLGSVGPSGAGLGSTELSSVGPGSAGLGRTVSGEAGTVTDLGDRQGGLRAPVVLPRPEASAPILSEPAAARPSPPAPMVSSPAAPPAPDWPAPAPSGPPAHPLAPSQVLPSAPVAVDLGVTESGDISPPPAHQMGDPPPKTSPDPQPVGHAEAPPTVVSQWAGSSLGTPATSVPAIDGPTGSPPRSVEPPPSWSGQQLRAPAGPLSSTGLAVPGPVTGAAPGAGFAASQLGAPASNGPGSPAAPPRPPLIPAVPLPTPTPEPGGTGSPPGVVDAPAGRRSATGPLALLVGITPRSAPRRSVTPARQLPAPVPFVEPRPGLCCSGADHPEHAQLSDPVWLAAPGAQRGPMPTAIALSDTALLDGYDPQGGMPKRELDRRFVIRSPTAERPGEYSWPSCELQPEGAADAYRRVSELLAPGTELDLLGSVHGRVLAAAGTSLAQRSVPPEYAGRRLFRLTTQVVLPVWRVQVAAWFGQPGGGIRYRLTHPVAELVAAGALVHAGGGPPGDR